MDDAAPITSSPAAAPGPVPEAAPLTSGPLTVGPSDAFQPTFDEGLETAASSAWNSLPTVRMAGAAAASDADAPVRTDETETQSWFAGATVPLGHGGPAAPQPTPINPEDANAANKAAGGTLTPFTSPVGPNLFNHMLQQNLREQQSDATIALLAPGIGGTVARFGVGALVSLADPLNDAAMFIPGAPEAWVARAIAEAGGGLAARVGVRAASGAVQGAAGMAALQPLTAMQDAQDHEDFSWGDALRQVAFGAMLGAGGGALHGLLGGAAATPEDVEAVTKAAIARVVGDDPRGVDIQGIIDNHAVADPTGPAAVFAELDAAKAPDEAYRDMLSTGTKTPLEDGETWRDRAAAYVDSTTPTPEEAAQSAQDTAARAMNKTDPELVRTARTADATIADAPKLEGIDPAKDASEIDQMAADQKAQYDMLVAAGKLSDTKPETIGRDWLRTAGGGDPKNLLSEVDGGQAADALASHVQAALDRGDTVVLKTDGGDKLVPIVNINRGMMQDAIGQRWGTMSLLTNAKESVEITPKPSPAQLALADAGKDELDIGKGASAYANCMEI